MTAHIRRRRKMTAREAAERTGLSIRTIQRIASEPREEFEGRARARRTRAVELRREGYSYKQIAELMECSYGTVGRLLHDACAHGEWSKEDRAAAKTSQ